MHWNFARVRGRLVLLGALTTLSWVASCGRALPGCAEGSCPAVENVDGLQSPIVARVQSAVPLAGCGYSHYLMNAQVGSITASPLIFDTGSEVLAVAAQGCSTCNTNSVYVPAPNDSATAPQVATSYGDGGHGFAGYLYDDNVTLGTAGTQPAVPMHFIGIENSYGGFLVQASCVDGLAQTQPVGIVGMGADNQVPTADPYIQASDTDVFAVQACDLGGQVWFDGYDPNFTSGAPVSVPVDSGDGHWQVFMQSLTVAGTSAMNFNAPALIDSGTPGLVLPTAQAQALAQTLSEDAHFSGLFQGNDCQPMPAGQTRTSIDAHLPAVTIKLAGPGGATGSSTVQLTLGATSSYIDVRYKADGTPLLCPSIATGSSIVLGSTVMRGFVTIFDNAAKTVSFAPQRGCASITASTLQGMQ